jgi:hypothetical protein
MVAADISKYKQGKAKDLAPDKKLEEDVKERDLDS